MTFDLLPIFATLGAVAGVEVIIYISMRALGLLKRG